MAMELLRPTPARDALRSYVSADTRRLDWLESRGGLSRYFTRASIDSAMRERPQDV